jgi:predicted dinucleotide-binding enzyme
VASTLGRPVVKAFNNIVAGSLATRGAPEGSKERIALSVAGDDPKGKQRVLAVIQELGFDAIDAGTLSESGGSSPVRLPTARI